MGLFLFLILHPIPNHSFLYSHMTVKTQYAQTQTVVCLKFKASHKKKNKMSFSSKQELYHLIAQQGRSEYIGRQWSCCEA